MTSALKSTRTTQRTPLSRSSGILARLGFGAFAGDLPPRAPTASCWQAAAASSPIRLNATPISAGAAIPALSESAHRRERSFFMLNPRSSTGRSSEATIVPKPLLNAALGGDARAQSTGPA